MKAFMAPPAQNLLVTLAILRLQFSDATLREALVIAEMSPTSTEWSNHQTHREGVDTLADPTCAATHRDRARSLTAGHTG